MPPRRSGPTHATRHTRSFHHGPGLLELPCPTGRWPTPTIPRSPTPSSAKDRQIEVQTRAGDRVYQMVVEYAFGTRERYVTMIGRDDGQELSRPAALVLPRRPRVRAGDGPRATSATRYDREHPRPEIDVRDGVVRCLYCHVTRSRDFRDPPPEGGPGPEAADSGIGCERCHGPGGNHVAAIKHDFTDRAHRQRRPARRPRRSMPSAPTAISSACASRDRERAGRSEIRPVARGDLDLQPLLHRERRRDELPDLPRPPSRRRAFRRLLRSEMPVVPLAVGRQAGERRPRPTAAPPSGRLPGQSGQGLPRLPHAQGPGPRPPHEPDRPLYSCPSIDEPQKQ